MSTEEEKMDVGAKVAQLEEEEDDEDEEKSKEEKSKETVELDTEKVDVTSPPSSPLPSSPPTPPSPATQRQRELDEVRETCADWMISIPSTDPANDMYCSRCSNRSIEKHKCPGCGESVCSYYCFDINGDNEEDGDDEEDGEPNKCWKCKGWDLGKGERVVSQPKYTLADLQEYVRVRREIGNPATGGHSKPSQYSRRSCDKCSTYRQS